MPTLETLDYDHTVHEAREKHDDKLMVRFYKDVVPDEAGTKDAGYKKFREAIMVQIVVPGNRRQITIREAREDDIRRFEKHYNRFKANDEVQMDGFPLAQWPLMTRAQVEELRYFHFYTVEHVANAQESVMSKYPGLRELSRRAQAWLTTQKEAAPVEKLQTQIDDLAQQNKVLQEQIALFMKESGKNAEHAVATATILANQAATKAK